MIAHRFAWAITHPDQELPPVVAHGCDNTLCQNPAHLHASTPAGNRAEWAARRHQPGSPLRDTRGALARARALRAALRAGVPLADVIAAGAPPVDVGQGTLW